MYFLYNMCVSRQHFLSSWVPYTLLAVHVCTCGWEVCLFLSLCQALCVTLIYEKCYTNEVWLIDYPTNILYYMVNVYNIVLCKYTFEISLIFKYLFLNFLYYIYFIFLKTLWSPWSSDCTTTLSYAVGNKHSTTNLSS